MVLILEPAALSEYVYLSGPLILALIEQVHVSTDKDSDISLIRRTKKGDTGAFDELVMRYQRQIFFSVIRIVLNREDANDVVQDTFIKAFRNLDRFDEKYRFYTWIYRIGVNTALNLIQRRKNREYHFEYRDEEDNFNPPDTENPDNEIEHREFKKYVQDALNILSLEMRSVFVLRVYDELTYQEIADVMSISLGTVMSRLNRARTTLKKHLLKSNFIHKQP
jgi:RNA polymerase sigma-70 factor (ECF subfamily)